MVAVPKKKEFKGQNARFYGKMTFEMRLFQTVTEKNIADEIFPFIKHQSMTMNEKQLLRIIQRMTTLSSLVEGENYVFIVLDFFSWCTNFRYEFIYLLFCELDALFGIKDIYTFLHCFSIISFLLFQDRFCPLRQSQDGTTEPGPRCYCRPEAWLESLRQKG
ncbi:hypothetical protein PUN28_020749 [Cardiocondyla obscurior]|uniref:RdRp catalytic domain-containing protein n=1 Tax=Cardiocondyla obscurior TaxID=286306 RepID=A0AAW2EAW2_9HYME